MMDKNNNDKDAGASDHSAGKIDINHADSAGSLKDEEKMGEDAMVAADRPSEETLCNTGLKTPEDEGKKKDISNVQGEKLQGIEEAGDGKNARDVHEDVHEDMHEDVQRNNEEATSLPPLKGRTIIVTTPDESNNTDAAQEAQEESAAAAVIHTNNNNDDDDESVVVPGFMFIAGPDYTGTGIFTGYDSNAEEDNIDDEGGIIFEGFLPEDDPSRRRRQRNSSRAESGGARGVRRSTRERVQRLIDNAITLDDSAVTPIPMDEEGNNGSRRSDSSGDDEVVKSGNPPWFLPLVVVVLAACVILAIALPLSLRGESENEAPDTTASLSDADCLLGEVDVRFELAKSILSSITSPDLLEDESTPQGKAIRWIVCDDSISVQLLENQDPVSGNLPKQKHGFRLGGDAGEAQVIRRYILAVFSYSTSQVSPWNDSLNFLSADLHECNWHRNYTRGNFPFGGKKKHFMF
jgi:hypothetical protein